MINGALLFHQWFERHEDKKLQGTKTEDDLKTNENQPDYCLFGQIVLNCCPVMTSPSPTFTHTHTHTHTHTYLCPL